MKNKYVTDGNAFSFRMNEEEFKMVQKLKDKYAINISGSFKMFLRRYLKVLEDNDKNIQV